MSLYTIRLVMRPWNFIDAEYLFDMARDPRVGVPAGWRPHESFDESMKVLKDILIKPNCFAIVRSDDCAVIGCITLKFGKDTDLTDKNDECEVGYWLGVPYWDKGYMTEAFKEVLRYAFEDLAVKKVWAGYYDGNLRSKRVQEKCGFKYHHTTEDVFVPQLNETRVGHVMCLTKADWKKS